MILQRPPPSLILGMEEVKSRFKLLLFGLGLSYVLFSLCRLAFLIFNFSYFSTNPFSEILLSFLFGIWFDTVPVFYYNLLFIFLLLIPNLTKQKKAHTILTITFLATNGIAIAQNLIDIAYFPFNKKRTGAEILHLSNDWNAGQIISYFTDFWFLLLIFCVFLFVSYKILMNYFSSNIHPVNTEMSLTKRIGMHFSYTVFIVGITLLGLRGGFGLIPLRTFDAGRFVNTSLVPLTINTPFQFICTVEGNNAPKFDFMTDSEASQIIQPIKQFESDSFKKKNIVIIIVESLGKEYMGFYNNGKGFTPFLDSLCSVSLSFEHSFANGTTSMDAPPAIFSGIPNLMDDSYIISQFNINTPQSIGSILAREGYNSSFYHGGKNGTMGFDNFISQCGMGNYFGMNEYPNKEDFDGKWGIPDEKYLNYYASELNEKQEPFISSVFTLSSHHPYTVPAKYKDKLPKGTLPIHQSIAYADLSLKQFFAKAQKQKWYQNTLFVITADHTSDSDNPKYQTTLGRFSIPIFFYSPSNDLRAEIKKNTIQQSLILPTLLNMIGYSKPFFSLGNSGLDTNSFAVFYSNSTYYLVENDYLVALSPSKESHLYNWEKDPYLSSELEKLEKKNELELKLKAYLQTYSTYLHSNSFGTGDDK